MAKETSRLLEAWREAERAAGAARQAAEHAQVAADAGRLDDARTADVLGRARAFVAGLSPAPMLTAFLRRKFDNENIRVVARPKIDEMLITQPRPATAIVSAMTRSPYRGRATLRTNGLGVAAERV